MRLYVNNLEPDLQVTLCDDEPLDLTDPSIDVKLEGYWETYDGEQVFSRTIDPAQRSLVDGCTVLDMDWVDGDTARAGRIKIRAMIYWPPNAELQEVRMLRSVRVRA